MSENAVVELGGEAARMIALQFLGQNLGEMKELDKNIVSSLKPIAGTINPQAMLNSIAPAAPQQVHIAPPPQPSPYVQQPQLIPVQPSIVHTEAAQTEEKDPNQLELNFNTNPYTERVFEKLELLERRLSSINDTQQEIISQLNDIKKKLEV
jgi:hypothetical protein